jgi:hypothetical protein
LQKSKWNNEILNYCHPGEKFRLLQETLYQLNKSNSKYVKVGYSPFDDFKLQFHLWDKSTDIHITLSLSDLVKIRLFLSRDYKFEPNSLILSKSNLYVSEHNTRLLYLIDNDSKMKLTFQVETLQNLVKFKQFYAYTKINFDFEESANEIVHILSAWKTEDEYDKKQMQDLYHKIVENMKTNNKFILAELMYKFPTTLLSIVNNVSNVN